METWIVKLEGLFKRNLAGVHFQKAQWSSVTAESTIQTELAQRLMPVEKVLAEKVTPEEEPKNIGIEVASGIGTGLGDAGEDFLTGIWDTVSDPLGAPQGIGQAVLHPVDTFTHIKTVITDSYERDVINGDAHSRAHWFSYAIGTTIGTVVGTKGAGAVAKSGAVTKTLSATKNVVNKSTLQNFLPYAPQNQFAFAGNVPFNTLNGTVVKENLIVRAKLELSDKGIDNPTTRLPRTNGKWEGEPGNRKWYSDKPEVKIITNGEGVEFINGRPNFSPWSEGDLVFEKGKLTGTANDFSLVFEQIQHQYKLPSKNAAKKLLKQAGVTPHHKSSTVIELIPTDLHGNIPHIGSVSDLRGGY